MYDWTTDCCCVRLGTYREMIIRKEVVNTVITPSFIMDFRLRMIKPTTFLETLAGMFTHCAHKFFRFFNFMNILRILSARQDSSHFLATRHRSALSLTDVRRPSAPSSSHDSVVYITADKTAERKDRS